MQKKNDNIKTSFPKLPADLLRFQVNLLSLAEERHESLHDEQWIEELTHYQLQLYRSGFKEFSHNLLHSLGETSVCPNKEYRQKALFLLTIFLGNVIEEADDDLLQAFSWIFLRWLYQEEELLSCSEFVCSKLPIIPEQLLCRGMFAQFTVWLELLEKISSGELERPPTLQALIGRMKDTLLGGFIGHQVNLEVKLEDRSDAESIYLLNYFAGGRAGILISELYHSRDKDRRLALVEILAQLGESIAIQLLEELGEDAPWYMVRNALKVISQFDCNKHLQLALPFLQYPDLRVQQQVVDFICNLKEAEKVDKLIYALETCHDRLKENIVKLLDAFNAPEIEQALARLLQSRYKIDSQCRDQLLITVCKSLEVYPEARTIEALNNLIDERKHERRLGDPVAIAAETTIHGLTAS